MKRFNIKSIFLCMVIGAVGITTVFAANGIKSATLSNTTVTLNGDSVPLNNSLISIQKENEKNVQLYMPVRELLEYLGYSVNWDEENDNIDLVMKSPNALEIAETPEITASEVNDGNESLRKYYDNDSEIAKAQRSSHFYSLMRMSGDFKFDLFIGCISIYEFDMEKSAELTINLQSNITKGKFKLVLVSDESKVITVSESVTSGSVNIENTFSLPKGKHKLKIVGLDTSGDFVITLSGDEALKFMVNR